jgi:uncharacterized protein (TIGR03435 family)
MRVAACFCCAALLTGAAFSQSSEPAPAFEAADVHESGHSSSPFPFLQGPFLRGGRYELRFATLVDLIAVAYGVPTEKVVGGPSWLEMDRFNIVAKVPARSPAQTHQEMLKALLAERFKLVVHDDTRPLPAYALTAGKHPTMKKADGTGQKGCKFVAPPAPPGGGRGEPLSSITFTCHSMTMAALADELRDLVGTVGLRMPGASQVPVVDQTQLAGSWDFDLSYSLPGMRAGAGDRITIFDAVEKLGLKLEPAEVPLPVVVVDSVNRKPTPNAPDIEESLHLSPPPTEFEVAEVKPTDTDFRGMRFQIQPGGRVNLQGVTLKFLIAQAWNLAGDMIVGAPKWMDTDRFDIIGKTTTDVVPATPNNQAMDVDLDAVFQMVRSLVVDRFKLVTHTEERPLPAYTLIAVKPRMKKADPNSRTLFKEGPPTLTSKDPRLANPALSRLVTVQNMTMAQFAEKLRSIAPGYIHSPVLDATGLEGSWDFTLSFSPVGLAGGGRGGRGGDGPPGDAPPPASGAVPEAPDPGGGITLLEAIEKEIGLKMVLQKRAVTVLVIDHVEEKPDN